VPDYTWLLVGGFGAVVSVLWLFLKAAVDHLASIDEAVEALRRRYAPDELDHEIDEEIED
jgi:hypothetical protein